jgi:nucleotide-binding universal stress UspA family protein
MFQHILLPTDGSASADKAAETAADLAERYGARLSLISVIDPVPFISAPEGAGEALAYYLDAAEEAARTGLEQAAARALAAKVPCQALVLREHAPAAAIVAYAQANAVDLIVMGSHGRRGLDAVILGSVAHKVLTLATIAVMVVK